MPSSRSRAGRKSSRAGAPSLRQPADELLAGRLRLLGLRGVRAVRTHTNRTVMVSLSRDLILRLHRGYAYAPDRVLKAIVKYLRPRVPRVLRRALEQEFLAFPVEEFVEPRRRTDAARPGDVLLLYRLERLHAELNARHFGGELGEIPFRISSRMRTRLGEVSVDLRTSRPLEIAISRQHILEHPWEEVEHTMLHEMVHQWQAENGLPVDHGPGFREKAEEVGVQPKARRQIRVGIGRRVAGARG